MAIRHRRGLAGVAAAWLLLAHVSGAAALSLDLCCPPASSEHACCDGMSAGVCPMHKAAAAHQGEAVADEGATPACERGCGSHEALLGLVLSAPAVMPAAAMLSRPGGVDLPAPPGASALRARPITPPAPPPWR